MPLSDTLRDKLRAAFVDGALLVRSVSPDGVIEWKRVLAVQRAEIGPESVWEATTERGPMVLTGGHRVFVSSTEKAEMETLRPGQRVLGVFDDEVGQPVILSVKKVGNRKHMYDLTAEDWHNFVLHQSGVVVSNSPDRNYHFRPPTHEGTIGCYNQVFGYIWEDEELIEYLKISLDEWNMRPPETEELCTIDAVCQRKPAWKAALLWGAVVHAAMALSFNWVADEFSVGPNSIIRVYLPDGRVEEMAMSDLYEVVREGS